MSMFHVGQHVAYVGHDDERFPPPPPHVTEPVIGCVYTVRGFVHWRGHVGILLEEIINPLHPCGLEWAAISPAFRPVKDTSIEIFRSLLSPIPEEVA